MPRKKKVKPSDKASPERVAVTAVEPAPTVIWLKAVYAFHSFAYRDSRSAFSSAMGLPVVSPTAIVLGIASTLFSLGEKDRAEEFLKGAHRVKVVIDPPQGMIFFRAFHQIRRYESGIMKTSREKFKPNARLGLTLINQGTREYGIPEGSLTVYVGTPNDYLESVMLALRNRDHLGTHDSLCSLVGDVIVCDEPKDVVYCPLTPPLQLPKDARVTVIALSRFRGDMAIKSTVGEHWWMAGGDDTELVPYLIRGSFRGTTRGKIYTKG